MESQPYRAEWNDFPDLLILKEESTLKQDLLYTAAKVGDAEAAATMLESMITSADIARIQQFIKANASDARPILAAVHAYENSLNAIPAALARTISDSDHALEYSKAISLPTRVRMDTVDWRDRLHSSVKSKVEESIS